MDKKFALYIDGENISPALITDFFTSKDNLDNDIELIEKKIYFSESTFKSISKKYKKVIEKFNLELVVCKEYRRGKNCADIKIVIDILKSAYTDRINNYLIASSDTDFIELVVELKGLGKTVYGLVDNAMFESALANYVNDVINVDKPIGLKREDFLKISFKDLINKVIHIGYENKKIDDKGFINIDQIPRLAPNVVYNFNYKKKGFKKIIDYINAHKKYIDIKEIKKENNIEYKIRLKKGAL